MKITLNYKDDNVNGVAVNVADESFVISLHDAENRIIAGHSTGNRPASLLHILTR